MIRPLRIEYPNAWYRIRDRVRQNQDLYTNKKDRKFRKRFEKVEEMLNKGQTKIWPSSPLEYIELLLNNRPRKCLKYFTPLEAI